MLSAQEQDSFIVVIPRDPNYIDHKRDRNYIDQKDSKSYIQTKSDFSSGTAQDDLRTFSPIPIPERFVDPKTGLSFYILDIPREPTSIDQTEGILSDVVHKMDEEGIEPVDLVKRAWKTSE